MRRFLLVTWLALCLGCGRSKAVPITSESASPKDVVAPRPAPPTECERGPLHYSASSDEEQRRLIDAFETRNHVVSLHARLDPLGRYVTMSGSLAVPQGGGPDITDAEMEAGARAFLRKNADLCGIEPEEVDGLARRGLGGIGNLKTMRFESMQPIPGYELFEIKRELRFTVDVDPQGGIRSATNQSNLLPPFSLCTKPRLAPDDPAVRKTVLGRSAQFGDIGGRMHTVGPATEKDLGPPTLRIFVGYEGSNGERRTIALAYAMSLFGDGFTAFVDANTGKLLEIRRNFAT